MWAISHFDTNFLDYYRKRDKRQEKKKKKSSRLGTVETTKHEVVGSIPGLSQWVKDLVLL